MCTRVRDVLTMEMYGHDVNALSWRVRDDDVISYSWFECVFVLAMLMCGRKRDIYFFFY